MTVATTTFRSSFNPSTFGHAATAIHLLHYLNVMNLLVIWKNSQNQKVKKQQKLLKEIHPFSLLLEIATFFLQP